MTTRDLCKQIASGSESEIVFNLVGFKDSEAKEVLIELTLRKGERRGQLAFVDTSRTDRNTMEPSSGDRVAGRWRSMYNTFARSGEERGQEKEE